MAIDTRRVTGRRKLRYDSFEDLLADAENLSATEVRSLGNWSLGQTLKHLGAAMEGSISGKPFKVPLMLRVLGFLFIRRRLINGPFPSGFQLPRSAAARLIPTDEVSSADGLAALRAGIARLRSESNRMAHPVAGRLSIAQWDSFHLRHAEMHMSFLQPVAGQ